jgi:hypothetical protein
MPGGACGRRAGAVDSLLFLAGFPTLPRRAVLRIAPRAPFRLRTTIGLGLVRTFARVMFCFSKPKDAEAFAKRFSGDRLPESRR